MALCSPPKVYVTLLMQRSGLARLVLGRFAFSGLTPYSRLQATEVCRPGLWSRSLTSMCFGASVGDSGAWLVWDGTVIDLTEQQVRKPLLGSGAAHPVAFGPVPMRGRLVVATDGLFKYATRARLVSAASRGGPESAVTALIDAVRMPSGRLQDDVGVVVCQGTR